MAKPSRTLSRSTVHLLLLRSQLNAKPIFSSILGLRAINRVLPIDIESRPQPVRFGLC